MRTKLAVMAMLAITGGCCLTQPAETHIQVKAKVALSDGSLLLGTLCAPSLALTTEFGALEIPPSKVSALDFVKDGVRVTFHNKDVLSGGLGGAALELDTVLGNMKLAYPNIKSVQFFNAGVPGMDQAGLLLHVLFDSENEDLGRFGAKMEAKDVRIIEGRCGNAMLLDSRGAKVAIDLPFSPYTMPEGTIEFWAKLPQPHQRFRSGGCQPWLFCIQCPESGLMHHFILGFTSNNGNGKGGLVGCLHGLAFTGTHSYGAVSTVAETGVLGNTPDGWHHYAFIWKRAGLDFPQAQGKTLLLVVDGKIVASTSMNSYADVRQAAEQRNTLVIHDENPDFVRPVAMSDMKIWNFAKFPKEN